MSKIQWEFDLVERPFCEQLKAMGWEWLEGDVDVPELTERSSFGEVLLRDRLRRALRTLNRREGREWLDEERVELAIANLERAPGHALIEKNEAVTQLLIKGTVVPGLPDWDGGREQPVRYIDFEHPERNDFLVVNQFKVQLASGAGHVIPDAVLFINGIPIVVAELKSPGIQTPLHEAINQLLRYSNQRKVLYPALYSEHEGIEKLFHTNQLMVASSLFEARASSVGAPPEAYLEWADPHPYTPEQVASELGLLPPAEEVEEAATLLSSAGPEQVDRPGTPLFFRDPARRAAAQAGSVKLQSQQILVAGMLRPAHLLDLVHNFTVFEKQDGQTRKIVARYQQFRSVQKIVRRLKEGRRVSQGAERDERGGIVWHTQGSGKSLSMIFLIRKMRLTPDLKRYKVVAVTDRTDLEQQLSATAALSGEAVRPTDVDKRSSETATERTQRILREATPDIVFAMLQKMQETGRPDSERQRVQMTVPVKRRKPGEQSEVYQEEVTFRETVDVSKFPELNRSEEILVLIDEAHRGHTLTLHRNLRTALPNATFVGFTGTPILAHDKKQTFEIFGPPIDRYLTQDAELDGATVPILYEGRTADGLVEKAAELDQRFEDLFRDYTAEELAAIKAKYATQGDVLEAPLLIEQKARDMIRHYVSVVLPGGFKAQVVATSREAAVTYLAKLEVARSELLAAIEALPAEKRGLTEEALAREETEVQFLVGALPYVEQIRALEVAVVISGDHNDPESWRDWSDKDQQKDRIKRFKRKLAVERGEKTDPLAMLVVNNMLLTGFDAPVEQVMYLDRKVVAHDLLQAIARVNRTSGRKRCGYVVDYVGVARNLQQALKDYDQEDVAGALVDIGTQLPLLLEQRDRAVGLFKDHGVTDLFLEVGRCVELLADLSIRAEFINRTRAFFDTLGILEHRPEVPADVFRDAKLLGFINKVAANLYRDAGLDLLGVAERVKTLINEHVSARGVDPKIPPISITNTEAFEELLKNQAGGRAKAAQMQYAARHHIVSFVNKNPGYADSMSQRLEEILQRFKDDWDALERELRKFIEQLRVGDRNEFPELDPQSQVPFVRVLLKETGIAPETEGADKDAVIQTALDVVRMAKAEVHKVGFWRSPAARERLTRRTVQALMNAGLCDGREEEVAHRLVALAKENHVALTRP
jgi:type I restriction enzyme R subunit